MRYAIAFLVALGASFCAGVEAQTTGPLVRTIGRHVTMQDFEISTYTFLCPTGYIPVSYSFTPKFPYDVYEEEQRNLIDHSGSDVSRTSLSSMSEINGGGFTVTLNNVEHHAKEWEALITCMASAASSDNTLVFAKGTTAIPKQTGGTATALCPAEYPVALGGFSNADAMFLQDVSSAPVWGTSASVVSLADAVDGQMAAPAGWQVKVYNNYSGGSLGATSIAICGKSPSLQTFVYSTTVPEGAFGIGKPFSIFAPVPDGWVAAGTGFDGGPYGKYSTLDLWMQDGIVVNMLQWYPDSKGYDSGPAEARAYMVRGTGNAPLGNTSSRAVVAVLAIPKSAAPPTNVSVVEFYHAGLDHYFITAIAQEIADLDAGVHPGWVRTGQSFKAYGIGSTGRTGRRPVCRAYGQPSAGLDSHFYSASPDECVATMQNFGGAWGLEASEVFEMDLPDALTGACPAGGVPIYRIFNQRKDVNHRYTTSTAIRDQMVAKGGVAEGYGANAVTLCGLP